VFNKSFEANRLIIGDCRKILRQLPIESINTIIFSPPYWRTRIYNAPTVWTDGSEVELGQEASPEKYIEHLLEIIECCRRVLRPDGSCWIVINDTYYKKKLALVPERLKLALEQANWLIREDLIWAKQVLVGETTIGIALPRAVKDRFNTTHEHLLHLTKQKEYYFDLDSVRIKPKTQAKISDYKSELRTKWNHAVRKTCSFDSLHSKAYHPKGKNLPSVWVVNPPRFPEAHFAVYPERLIELPIKTTCPELVCSACNSPYYNKSPSCNCDSPALPGLVLDPLVGSGTTCLVAKRLRRRFLGIDIKPEFIELARKRLNLPYHSVFRSS